MAQPREPSRRAASARRHVTLLSLCLVACGDSSSGSTDAAVEGDASTKDTSVDAPVDAGDSDAGAEGDAGSDAGDTMYPLVTRTLGGTSERGQYLVDKVLVCGVCHTPSLADGTPDPAKYLAGSRSYDFTDLDGTIVTVNAENLTSHDPEGLHAWSDAQIRRALTVGVDDENIAIYPIMPYPEYALLTDDDVDSIIRYLRGVAPNDNVVAADFPYFDQYPPAPQLSDGEVPHTTLAKSDADYAAAERGRYLAMTACLNCHTEEAVKDGKTEFGVPAISKAFAGGKKYTLIRGAAEHTSTNITPDVATGIGSWSVDDIVSALKSNTDKTTQKVLCNSHPGGPERLGGMAEADLRDIATYLHTLPPIENGPFTCEAAK